MNNVIAGRYQVVKHIGQGGMADVFLAWDTVLNRDVAIKVLRGDMNLDPIALIRFKQEAASASKLSHPNIIEIYDVGEFNNRHFIVMEYISGKTLKQIIATRGAVIKEEAVAIMRQLVSAVIHAHTQGVIHRDIKSQNIIVKPDGTLKILDFGIALANDSLQLTHSDSVMGSVHYLAPELARGEAASYQSDIYALGIVFFELLVGDVPFKGDQMVKIALKHMNEQIPNVRMINSTVPQSIDNIIAKSTCKERSLRYQDAYQLLSDLNSCLDQRRMNERPVNLQNYNYGNSNNNINRSQSQPILKPRDFDRRLYDNQPGQGRPRKKKKNKVFLISGIIFSLIAVVSIVALLAMTGIIDIGKKMIAIPNIVNVELEAATKMLEDVGLVLDFDDIKREMTEATPKGNVISVVQGVAEEVEVGSKVNVVVSDGIYATMGDFIGQDIDTAKQQLSAYPNIRVVEEAMVSDMTPGTILRQELIEAGAQFDPERSGDIRLVYSAYKSVVIDHNIKGMDIEEARLQLEALGMQVTLSMLDISELPEDEQEDVEKGTVVDTSPASGTQYTQKGTSTIVLYYYN